MLAGACLRLITTIILGVRRLNEPMPDFIPTRGDLAILRRVVTRAK
jgi:hypothetical protein